MNIETKYLGLLSVQKSQIFFFYQAIPGFSKLNYFALIKDQKDPFCYHLQSIENKNVCFRITQGLSLSSFYKMSLNKQDIHHLRLKSYNMEIYHILSLKKNLQHLINLKAPLVFNASTQKAKQCLVQEDYPVQYPLLKLNDQFFLEKRNS